MIVSIVAATPSTPTAAVPVRILLVLEVADEGPGVSDADLERLGERFWRGADRQQTEGTGLGLNIARTLLASMDGDIGFAHAAASGLIVRIRLPRLASGIQDP